MPDTILYEAVREFMDETDVAVDKLITKLEKLRDVHGNLQNRPLFNHLDNIIYGMSHKFDDSCADVSKALSTLEREQ